MDNRIETTDESSKQSYDHIIIRGNPFTRGRSYGQQTKNKIHLNLKYYKNSGVLPDYSRVQKFIANNYIKALEKYYMSALLEMKGIAIGANVSIDDIILLNARYELLRWKRQLSRRESRDNRAHPQECTGAVCLSKATKSGEVLMGQNWDINQRILNEDIAILLEVHPDPSEDIVPFFMLTEAGQLGRSGMNANGLGIIAMGLYSSEDHFDDNSKNGFLPISLLRRMFVESPTFPVALKRILSVPRHSSVNMIVATAEGEAINIEMTPNHYFISYPSIQTDIFTHSNHFKSEGFLANNLVQDLIRGGSTLFRDRQLEKELIKNLKNIDENSFAYSFQNHLGFPDSLCQHIPVEGRENNSNLPNDCTVANIIYNLTKRKVRLYRGQPCDGLFSEYHFKYKN